MLGDSYQTCTRKRIQRLKKKREREEWKRFHWKDFIDDFSNVTNYIVLYQVAQPRLVNPMAEKYSKKQDEYKTENTKTVIKKI